MTQTLHSSLRHCVKNRLLPEGFGWIWEHVLRVFVSGSLDYDSFLQVRGTLSAVGN